MGNDLELSQEQAKEVEALMKFKKDKLVKKARELGGYMKHKEVEEATKNNLATFIVLAKAQGDPGASEPSEPSESDAKQPGEQPKPAIPATPAVEEDSVAKMKKLLDAMPKVRINLPLMPGEKRGTFQPVSINGYTLNVPKGISVDVPEEIANMLSQRYDFELGTGNIELDNKMQANAKAEALA